MFHPDVYAALCAQITRERYANVAYLCLSSWADNEGFDGAATYFANAATEETSHAKTFIDYVNKRSWVTFEPVPAPDFVIPELREAFAAALTLEQSVTQAINDLYALACTLDDYATADVLRPFLLEQVEAEKELTTYVQRLNRMDADIFDLELLEALND